jgi:hypothetical protein
MEIKQKIPRQHDLSKAMFAVTCLREDTDFKCGMKMMTTSLKM